MKIKYIIGSLLITVVLMSTISKETIIITKPAVPKSIITRTWNDELGLVFKIEGYIKSNAMKGYILKSVVIYDSEGYSKGIVIMEKY